MTLGFIYRIFCLTPGVTDEYIGSTTDMRKRKCVHKSKCNNENDRAYNLRVYQFIRENGGWDEWRMEVIEQVEFEHKWQLTKREGELIQSRGATLNSQIAGRTDAEYRLEHREEEKERYREYYQTHREKEKERFKEYYQTHREESNEKSREYYQTNREELNVKFECLCGGRYTRQNRASHFKSVKHIKNYENGLYEYINS